MHLNAGLGILDWGNSVKQDSKNHAAFVLISLLAKYSMLVWHCTVQIIFVKTPYSLFHMILLKKINSIKSFCANLFPFACVLFGNRFISWKIMRTITRFQTTSASNLLLNRYSGLSKLNDTTNVSFDARCIKLNYKYFFLTKSVLHTYSNYWREVVKVNEPSRILNDCIFMCKGQHYEVVEDKLRS